MDCPQLQTTAKILADGSVSLENALVDFATVCEQLSQHQAPRRQAVNPCFSEEAAAPPKELFGEGALSISI